MHVMKIGKASGFSKRYILKTKAFLLYKNLGCEIAVGHCYGLVSDNGDSVSLIVNQFGEVVGTHIGP